MFADLYEGILLEFDEAQRKSDGEGGYLRRMWAWKARHHRQRKDALREVDARLRLRRLTQRVTLASPPPSLPVRLPPMPPRRTLEVSLAPIPTTAVTCSRCGGAAEQRTGSRLLVHDRVFGGQCPLGRASRKSRIKTPS